MERKTAVDSNVVIEKKKICSKKDLINERMCGTIITNKCLETLKG